MYTHPENDLAALAQTHICARQDLSSRNHASLALLVWHRKAESFSLPARLLLRLLRKLIEEIVCNKEDRWLKNIVVPTELLSQLSHKFVTLFAPVGLFLPVSLPVTSS